MAFAKIQIKPGWIYILRNPLFKDALVKIGRTKNSTEVRAKELSSPTGIPYQFEVLYEEEVADCAVAEQLIHRALDQYRINPRREFFQLPLKVAIRTVFQVCLRVNQSLIKERSRLAIWLNSSEPDHVQKLKDFLLPIRGGDTAVRLIYRNEKAECEVAISESHMVHCTPDVLTRLAQESWVQEVYLHTPLD